MADILRRLATELDMESSSLGPELLVSLLGDTRNTLVQQMTAAAVCNWAVDHPNARTALVAAGAVSTLVDILSDNGPEAAITSTATQALLALTCSCREGQDAVVASGGVPALLELLGGKASVQTGPALTDLVTGVLVYVATGSAANALAMVGDGVVETLATLLRGADCRPVVAEVASTILQHVGGTGDETRARVRRAGLLPVLLGFVDFVMGPEVARSAVQAVSQLLAGDEESQDEVRALGGVRSMLSLLRRITHDAVVAEAAAGVLWQLLGGDVQSHSDFKELDGVSALVPLLTAEPDDGMQFASTVAAGILGDLAESSRGMRESIREAGGVEALVAYLGSGPGEVGAEAACTALANLAVFSPGNQHAIREAGGIAALVSTLRWQSDDLRAAVMSEAARALGNLARNFANKDEVRRAGGIRELVGLLGAGGSAPSTGEAVVALGNLACDSLQNQAAIVAAGGVPRLLNILDAEETDADLAQAVACVLACLTACEEAAGELLGSITSLVSCLHRWVDVPMVMEASLNSLATLATFPGGPEAILRADGIEACVAPLSSPSCRNSVNVREVAAVALGNCGVGSAACQDAARVAGAVDALVEVVLRAAPSRVAPANFVDAFLSHASVDSTPQTPRAASSTLMRSRLSWTPGKKKKKSGDSVDIKTPNKSDRGSKTVESSGDGSVTARARTNALVMEVLVRLMESGPENMISEVAESALGSIAERLASSVKPESPTIGQQQFDVPVQVEAQVGMGGGAGDTATTCRNGVGSMNLLANDGGQWTLPTFEPVWEEEEDGSDAVVVRSVAIDPLRSKQVDALYTSWFPEASALPPDSAAAVSALAALTLRNEDNQAAVWQAGGVRLLESLLNFGRSIGGGGSAQTRSKVAEDAVRLMSDVVAAKRNQSTLLASGATELLVNMLRLGPRKELSYVVARAVCSLLTDHSPAQRIARELGAVEMLAGLLETSESVAGVGGIRSVLIALAFLCIDSVSSQRIFRKLGGIQLAVYYLSVPTEEVSSSAARLLQAVCRDNQTNRDAFRAVAGFRHLFALLAEPIATWTCVCALGALEAAVAGHPANQQEVHRLGGVRYLATVLWSYVESTRRADDSSCATSAAVTALVATFEDHPDNQDDAREAGVAPLLVRLLSVGDGGSSSSGVMSRAVEGLKVMARSNIANKETIRAAGGTQSLLQLTALNLETEVELVTGAVWALNNLAHGSDGNVEAVLMSNGVQRMLRIICSAPVTSEASVAASRLLFIIASASDEVVHQLRREGGMQPCTMLLTAGVEAETSLWASTLLGLLADGQPAVQDEVGEAGGVELLIRLLMQSSGAKVADLTVAAVRTLAVLLSEHGRNQDRAVAAGAIKSLIHLLVERSSISTTKSALTPRHALSSRAQALSTLATLSSVSTRTPLNSQLHSRVALKFGTDTAVDLSPESNAALSIELAEMVTVALGNLGSGSLKNRKAIRKAGGAKLLAKLMELQPGTNLFHLAHWAHDIVAVKANGSVDMIHTTAADGAGQIMTM